MKPVLAQLYKSALSFPLLSLGEGQLTSVMSDHDGRRRIRQVDESGTSIVSCAREVNGLGIGVERAVERAVEGWGAEEGEGADRGCVGGEVLQRADCRGEDEVKWWSERDERESEPYDAPERSAEPTSQMAM